jgi:purine-binding chemotaxis protein CheW
MTQTGAETSPKTLHRFLTFRVGEARYALPAEEVSEIIAMPTVSRLPHSPRALLGMANLRGDVIAVASLRNLLELPSEGALEAPGGPRGSARAIVLQGASPVALAIDAVDALVSLEATNVETRPAEVSASPGEMLRGIFQLGASKDTAKILDIRGLLAKTFTPRVISRNTARPTGPAQVSSAQEAARERLVSFEVAQQDYALPLAEVAEILSLPQAITPVAQSQAPILGIIPHRGRLLPLVSLRFLLGLPLAQAGGREKIIITAIAGVPVGLVADRMRAMLRAEPERIQPMPAVLAARTGGEARIKAIYHAEDGLVAILDTGKLFGDEVMNRLGKAVDTAHASEPTAQASIQKFLVFRLGAEEFGLPIGAVDEVVAVPEKHTKLPKTPKFLEGVTNLRGEVLPVIDQRRRFDLPPYEGDARRRRLIVVRTARHRAGLIVDAISEILAAPEEAIGDAPNLVGEPTRLVHGVINLKATERMVLLLDPDELLTRTERGLLDAFAATTRRPA